MEEKEKSSQRNILIVIAICICIIGVICTSLFLFSRKSNLHIHQMTRSHLQDIGDQSAKAIENRLQTVLEEVDYTAGILSEMDLSDEEMEILKKLRSKWDFDRIWKVDENGVVISPDHQILEHSYGGYAERILNGEKGITSIFRSAVNNEPVMCVFAPILQDGKVLGGIAGIFEVENMINISEYAGFGDQGYSYLIQEDGTLVVQSNHPNSFNEIDNIYSILEKPGEKASMTSVELRNELEAGKSGFLIYGTGSRQRMAYYTPILINGWFAFTAVPIEVVNSYSRPLDYIALQLILQVAVVFLLFSLFIIWWSIRVQKIILSSKSEVEHSNKKFEIAIRHTSSILFEYHMKTDQITFLSSEIQSGGDFPMHFDDVSQLGTSGRMVACEEEHRFRLLCKELRQGESMVSADFRGGNLFREERWFRLSMTALKYGKEMVAEAIGTLEDISDEKHAELRYIQEEQYRLAMLTEAITVWSVNLITGEFLSFSRTEKNLLPRMKNVRYSPRMIAKVCREIKEEDREHIQQLFCSENLIRLYQSGVREMKETFRMRLSVVLDYMWISCTINLLCDPTTGEPIIFAYTKNADEETKRDLELQFKSERDPLTSLYNRLTMEKKVSTILLRPYENGKRHVLMMMDLDGFKDVNDNYGHRAGDDVLRDVAKGIQRILGMNQLVCRLGGDEYMAFIEGIPSEETACLKAESICHMVSVLDEEGFGGYSLSVSVGLAFYPEDGEDFDTLYQNADKALYMAKHQGKNRVIIYEK